MLNGPLSLAFLIVIIIVAFSFYKLGFTRGFLFFKNSMKASIREVIIIAINNEIRQNGDLRTLLKKVGGDGEIRPGKAS